MEAEIKFEPDGRSGVVATGSYIYDAAKRMGVEIDECERRGESDLCAVEIVSGKNLLSEPTKAELETLGSDRFIKGERLACQTKIEAAGEIVIMAKKKKKSNEEKEKEKERKKVEEFRKEFEEMPLEKKIAALLELEAVALGETFSFVLNSPYKIIGKVMDVMAEFGLKMDKEEKDAKTPEEHKKAETNGDASGEGGGTDDDAADSETGAGAENSTERKKSKKDSSDNDSQAEDE
ncbi:MAG: (2Fe-2S)-binding protein [Acidobacteriota bacterium]|nr:(2Fe-2S)-binding protein [Acidobacteriota bacterium]